MADDVIAMAQARTGIGTVKNGEEDICKRRGHGNGKDLLAFIFEQYSPVSYVFSPHLVSLTAEGKSE